MSMFTRNEKASDTNTDETVRPPRETPAAPPAPAAARPAQPVAQPLSRPSQAPGVSVISKSLKITGQLESTEDIRIDGEVEGDVRGVSVTVGNGAKVKGTVYGNAVELAGTIEGKIEAEKVVLTSTAHMSGDVLHRDIRIESGAFIDGHCRPGYGKSEAKPVYSAPKPVATSMGLAAKPSDAALKT
ncbi:MAG TPA: polymer-forming cytoskeletal protein [Rhizomicrobium sp.]|jgi:cytoskeletal protein CcmA (bactofilin family)|nr:polymer-forming cytoskeletal protein [Rhizomicrobium sp.]